MPTLLLTRDDVIRLVEPEALVPLLRDAFRAYSLERTHPAHRFRAELPTDGTVMLLAPGLVPGIPAYTVKVHAKFPTQQPAIKGVIHLHDLETGHLLAIMDSTYITALRTGMSGALAAGILARTDATKVAIIGAGVQGRFCLQEFARLRSVEQVWVYDTNTTHAETYAQATLWRDVDISVSVSTTVAAAVRDADVVFTATWARDPFLFPYMVKQGVHITTLGADEAGKCEVSAELIHQSRFFCDDRDLAVTMGAIGGAGLGTEAITGELGEVIGDTVRGRRNSNDTTIYGGVGLAFQDLVVAWQVYQAALHHKYGVSIELRGS